MAWKRSGVRLPPGPPNSSNTYGPRPARLLACGVQLESKPQLMHGQPCAPWCTVRMTEGYTKIQLNRQADLTRRIQERLASAGEKLSGEHGADSETPESPAAKFAGLDSAVGPQTIQQPHA